MWGKKAHPPVMSATRSASEGLSRQELLKKTLHALSSDGHADRIGAWLEIPSAEGIQNCEEVSFRGEVWDRETDFVPLEWRQLAPRAPLPHDVLVSGRTVEQELNRGNLPMIGPLMELRRAMWVPIERGGRLRGLLLAGSRSRHGHMPKALLESVAAELALALGLEEEQRSARQAQADLRVARRTLESLGAQEQTHLTLLTVLEDCTSNSMAEEGLGILFAAIGSLQEERRNPTACPRIEFHWSSGDPHYANAVQGNAAKEIWSIAVATRRVTGGERAPVLLRGSMVRIVAIPLQAAGQVIGIFVAVLNTKNSAAAMLERLELRAALAASALGAWSRNQKLAEQILSRKSLLENSTEATILVDANGEIAAISAEAKRLLSEHQVATNAEPEDQSVGQRLTTLFRPSDQARIDGWCERVLSGVRERKGERRSGPAHFPEAVLNNGVRVRLRSVISTAGPYATVVMDSCGGQDSNTDRRAETELSAVLEWLDEGVILFDAQENVRALNTRFLQVTGLNSSDAAGLDNLETLIAKLSARVAEPWSFAQRWRNLARGIDGGARDELELLQPAPRVVQRIARPILDGSGRSLGRVEIYRDLTARRGVQTKLLHTEKLAALGQSITSVAHELNNPLTSILGYSQRLLQKEHVPEAGRELRQIFQEAERAATILRQLLGNAHESKPQLRTVSLNQVATQAMELQKDSVEQENIRIEMDLDPSWPMVLGDAGQLQQVLLNLTGNARQALVHNGKGGKIRVRTRQIGEQRVLLEIADDGPGISPEVIGRIFDPFFTTKAPGTGTGLGLSIVSAIVREHGGHINVASPPNGGAIFSIALRAASAVPAAAGDGAADKRTSSAASASGGALLSTVPLALHRKLSAQLAGSLAAGAGPDVSRNSATRVLVVEDEPSVAKLIADVLEDDGFQVDVLLDGREALHQAGRRNYDLVICDVKMPGMDGRDFYQALLQAGNPLSKQFLFVTGDVISHDTHSFIDRHNLPHVAKPFRIEELKNQVQILLQGAFPRVQKSVPVGKNG